MARKRQVDPEYPFEEEIAQLSIPARYFYILSWCHMDDTNGVLPYNAYKLKGQIFPEDDIDIEKLIQELVNMRRLFAFEAEGKKWLWCPTLLKHQIINHPSRHKYPNPPKELTEHYRSAKVALPLSRVELSRVELKRTEPSAVQLCLKNVDTAGFPIYKLLGYLHKASIKPPNEVVLSVCESFLKNQKNIKKPWPWMKIAFQDQWKEYNAGKNITESKELNQLTQCKAIQDLMKGIGCPK